MEHKGWYHLCAHPRVEVPKTLIVEFYANLVGTHNISRQNKRIRVRTISMAYDSTSINDLLQVNPMIDEPFKNATLDQMAQIVCGQPVEWSKSKDDFNNKLFFNSSALPLEMREGITSFPPTLSR